LTLVEKSLYNPASFRPGAVLNRPGFFWHESHKGQVGQVGHGRVPSLPNAGPL